LHHFGWNACSSALRPYAPNPHTERRYPVAMLATAGAVAVLRPAGPRPVGAAPDLKYEEPSNVDPVWVLALIGAGAATVLTS